MFANTGFSLITIVLVRRGGTDRQTDRQTETDRQQKAEERCVLGVGAGIHVCVSVYVRVCAHALCVCQCVRMCVHCVWVCGGCLGTS